MWQYGDILKHTDMANFENAIYNIEQVVKSYTYGSSAQDGTLWKIAYQVKNQLAKIKGHSLTYWHASPPSSLKNLASYTPKTPTIVDVSSEYKNLPQVVASQTVQINVGYRMEDMIYYAPLNKYYMIASDSSYPYAFYEYDVASGQLTPITQLRYFRGFRIFLNPYNSYQLIVIEKAGNICVVDPRNGFGSATYYNPASPTTNFTTSFHNIISDGRYIYIFPKTPRYRLNYYVCDYLVFDTSTFTLSWVEDIQLMSLISRDRVIGAFLGYDGYVYARDHWFSPQIRVIRGTGTSKQFYTVTSDIDTYYYGWIFQLPTYRIGIPYGYSGLNLYRIDGENLTLDAQITSGFTTCTSWRQICGLPMSYHSNYYNIYNVKWLERMNSSYATTINYLGNCAQLTSKKIYLVQYDSPYMYYRVFDISKGW